MAEIELKKKSDFKKKTGTFQSVYTTAQKSGVGNIFMFSKKFSSRVHLFDQTDSKIINTVKYYYNLK